MGHSFRILYGTLVGHSCETLLEDTLASHTCGALLLKSPTVNCHVFKTSVSHETFFKNSHLKSTKRAHRTRLQSHFKSAERALRTRHPPNRTCQVSKTSISRETSSNSHETSLQTSVSYETSSKSQAGSPIGAHAQIKQPRPHTNPNVTVTASRFPAPAAKICTSTRLTRTKSTAPACTNNDNIISRDDLDTF